MMPGETAWRVVYFEAVRQQLTQWGQDADRLGVLPVYGESLRTMNRHLTPEPFVWGDPLYLLRVIDLLVCRGFAQLFYVRYSVDRVRRLVYVMEVVAAPGSGLGSSGEGEPSPG